MINLLFLDKRMYLLKDSDAAPKMATSSAPASTWKREKPSNFINILKETLHLSKSAREEVIHWLEFGLLGFVEGEKPEKMEKNTWIKGKT